MSKPINITADVSESANKLLSPPAESAGKAIQTIIDFLRNTILLPLQKYNERVEHNQMKYMEDLKNGVNSIPEHNKENPTISIWGKTFEALKWNFDDQQEEIRCMFKKILLADIDKTKKSKVHPSFIDVVAQLSQDDAIFLKNIIQQHKMINIYEVRVYTRKIDEQKPNEYVMTDRKLDLDGTAPELFSDDFEVSLNNLVRLGILSEETGYWTDKRRTEKYRVAGKWKKIQGSDVEQMVEIVQNGRIKITEFGENFLDVCL